MNGSTFHSLVGLPPADLITSSFPSAPVQANALSLEVLGNDAELTQSPYHTVSTSDSTVNDLLLEVHALSVRSNENDSSLSFFDLSSCVIVAEVVADALSLPPLSACRMSQSCPIQHLGNHKSHLLSSSLRWICWFDNSSPVNSCRYS